jgi:rubredoxin
VRSIELGRRGCEDIAAGRGLCEDPEKGFNKVKFQAYCPDCGIRVSAYTMLTGNELQLTLHSEADIAVIHGTNVVHQWMLKNREKITLRDRIAAGTLSIGLNPARGN